MARDEGVEKGATVKTLRARPEVFDRLREISKLYFENQDVALERLIQVFELDKMKETLSERKADIDNMQMHLYAVMSGYLQSLQLGRDTEARVRVEFAGALQSKDEQIRALQEKEKELAAAIAAAKEEGAILAKSQKALKEQLATVSKAAEDKDKLAEALSGTVEELKEKNYSLLQRLQEQEQAIKTFQEVAAERDRVNGEVEKVRKELADSAAKYEEEKKRAAAETEYKYRQMLLEMEQKKQEEIGEIRKESYQDLRRQMEKVEKLRDEKDELLSQLRELQNKIKEK